MATRTESWEVKVASVKDWERWMTFVRTVQEEFHGIYLSGDANYWAAIEKNMKRSTAIYVEDDTTHEILGAMTYSPHSFHVGWLAVGPGHRRKGIGTALVRYMFTVLPKNVPLSVKTFLETDRPGKVAHAFYKSLGFTPREILEDSNMENAGHPFHLFVKG